MFIDYPYEDVMLRWEHATGAWFVRFDGQPERAASAEASMPNEARRHGYLVDQAHYERGIHIPGVEPA